MNVMHYQHGVGFILCVTGDAEDEAAINAAFDELLKKEKPHVFTKPVTQSRWINSPHRDPHPMFQIRCRGQYVAEPIMEELTVGSDATTVSTRNNEARGT